MLLDGKLVSGKLAFVVVVVVVVVDFLTPTY